MITTILIVWLLLTMPIMIEVEKVSKHKMGVIGYLAAFFLATISIPKYYVCVVKEFITFKK